MVGERGVRHGEGVCHVLKIDPFAAQGSMPQRADGHLGPMIADQDAIPQITRRGQLLEDLDQELGGQFLDGRGSVEVFDVHVGVAVSHHGQGADGRGRVIGVHHEIICIVVEFWARR